ncbi:MAG: biopolymer transporter ExbD [Hydrogenobacter thermophilus]|uniref:Biopolymer transport protein n=1 Tax=Hydrogenobacter thermophilus (strain DSM 6534 / IAM 12695 / TK-6) TaxID=608538 RepID=D3DJX2_HYDTT|nr:biopolymer transporter ExbD [Hydrogenobacter thermophilus]ADO46045.1 Biopolymer transport protein ExbD/TolR [Hydrogenobacter thermophilus TK-6]MCS7285087.1 biopolymer transporter ExbD [Hydrogenobacter thermophilus]BAI70124.1 biopolymer transport protein [Hydrogenobacter thermophilus TK-6]
MEDREFKDINVIPLVDIMLVLLTIVLITATFVVQGSIPVNLPTAKSQEVRELKGFEIAITKSGEILFEGKRVSLEDLERIISTANRDANIKVLADKDASVQSLVSVLDSLKRLGFTKVSIRTEIR